MSKSKEEIAGEAYQVIGILAHKAKLFDHPEVIRALDYFGYEGYKRKGKKGEILPFYISEKQDNATSQHPTNN